jgi:hypothetical protein
MYGLIQSAKLWYKELTRHLEQHGFKKCALDECVLVKRTDGEKYIVLLLYIDDILIMSQLTKDRYWVKDLLQAKYGKVMYDEGNRLPYLGRTIMKTDSGFEIAMESYIQDILRSYGKRVRDYVVPANQNLFAVQEHQEPIVEKAKFYSVVAKLLYLGRQPRPNILLPVQFLCTRVKSPTKEDTQKLERVLGYLNMTKKWTRALDKSPFERVVSYIDASFASHQDGKSQSACLMFLGNTLVHEACQKQKIIMKSSMEAELLALSDYLVEGELIEEFLMDIGSLMDKDFVTNVHQEYQDNQSAISLVKNDGGNMRSRYMKVRREYVKERLATGEVEIEYKPTAYMVADILMKGLGGEQFHNMTEVMLGNHRYTSHANNRGAKKNMHQQTNAEAGVASAASELV